MKFNWTAEQGVPEGQIFQSAPAVENRNEEPTAKQNAEQVVPEDVSPQVKRRYPPVPGPVSAAG